MKVILLSILLCLAFVFPANARQCHGAKITFGTEPSNAFYIIDEHLIVVNPNFVNKFSKVGKEFVIQHECGHAAGIRNELKADAYAARRLRKHMTPSVIKELCDDWGRDVQRCNNLKKVLKK